MVIRFTCPYGNDSMHICERPIMQKIPLVSITNVIGKYDLDHLK